MAKLTRVQHKIFGENGAATEFGKFGSLKAGTPTTTKDITTIQSLSNYTDGWFGAVTGNNSPAIEDVNALDYLTSRQMAYLFEQGLPEWDSATTYYIGSIVAVSGAIYVSRTDNNLNNLVSVTANWKCIGGDIFTALGDTVYGGANGQQTKLAGNITTAAAVLTQIGTGSVSAAPIWWPVLAPTVQEFLTGSGTYNKSYVFMVSGASATAGATYTNNAITFTVSNTISSGTLLVATGSGAPTASGTLTKASGTGDATIAFTAMRAPSYLDVEVIGAGGGGGGASTNGTGGAGGAGGNSSFGSTLVVGNGGGGGQGGSTGAGSPVGGAGGSGSIGTGVNKVHLINGGMGACGINMIAATYSWGGHGGSGFYGGAGGAAMTGAGNNGYANTGGGAAGGGQVTSPGQSGAGGGAGGYARGLIYNPAATYAYSIGAGGTSGVATPSGSAGGVGGSGKVTVIEYYQ